MKIKKESLCNLGIWLISLIAFTKSFFSFLYKGTANVAIILIIACLLTLFIKKVKNDNKSTKVLTRLWMVFLIVVLTFNNHGIKDGNLLNFIQYIAGAFIIVVLQKNDTWCEKNIKYIKIFSLTHLFFGIILLFFKDFLVSRIVPLYNLEGYYYNVLVHTIYNGCMVGLTSHYSLMGIYLSIGLCYYAGNIYNNDRKITIKRIAGMVIMIIGVVLSGKRSALLFPTIAVFITYMLFFKPKSINKKLKYIVLLSFIILIGGLVVIINPQLTKVASFDRLAVIFESDEMDSITNTRYDMLWVPAMKLFENHKAFGIGWGNFKYQFSNYLAKTNVRGNNAHNVYLQVLAETGIVGFVIIYSIIFYTFGHTLRILFKWKKGRLVLTDNQLKGIGISFTMQIYFLLYSLSGNPLYDSNFYLLYVLTIAMGIALEKNIKKEATYNNENRSIDLPQSN